MASAAEYSQASAFDVITGAAARLLGEDAVLAFGVSVDVDVGSV
jgi:hypothetical protein